MTIERRRSEWARRHEQAQQARRDRYHIASMLCDIHEQELAVYRRQKRMAWAGLTAIVTGLLVAAAMGVL